MTAIEMKYNLFRNIDTINDETLLRKLTVLVNNILEQPASDFKEDDDAIDYNLGGVDFGYPKTIEEVEAELELAEAERHDPTKWVSSENFHQRLEQRFPWLR